MPQTMPIRMTQPSVDVEQTGGGDRAGVRRQEGVGHRQAGQQRHGVEQDRLAAALRRGVDDRREDEDADVEEDRDAEDQAGEAHGERGALLAEEVQQPGRQHLGAAGDFEYRAEHGAQADDDRDVPEDAAHAGLDDRDGVGPLDRAEEFGDGETGGQADGYGDGEQRDERLEPDLDDQEEEQGDAEGGDRQQTGGAVDEEEQTTGVGGVAVVAASAARNMGEVPRVVHGAFGQGGSRHGARSDGRRAVQRACGGAVGAGGSAQPRTASASISMSRPVGRPT